MKPPTPKLSKKEQQILLDTVWSLHCIPATEKQESILLNAISNVKAFKNYAPHAIDIDEQENIKRTYAEIEANEPLEMPTQTIEQWEKAELADWSRALIIINALPLDKFKTNWWYICGMNKDEYFRETLFTIEGHSFYHISILNKTTLKYLCASREELYPEKSAAYCPLITDAINHNIGLHQKGDLPGDASYYMRSIGSDKWWEHERGTDMLGPDLVGWDYCNMHLSDGSKLCFYNLRYADGDYSTTNKAWYYDQDGKITDLSYNEYKTTIIDWWTSPKSGAKYPIKQSITVAKLGLNLTITPIIDDQEFNVENHTVYYEGACKVAGVHINLKTHELNAISGWGFIEITGILEKLNI